MNIYDAFISYRRSDGLEIAENLYRYLTARGLRVFFDKQEMIDSGYFTTQIENSLLSAPNYILIATNDVFRFRDGEDWVRREIEIAIERYEELPLHCNPVVLTQPNVCFPEKKDLPESVKNIVDVQRIMAQSSMDTALAFDRVLAAITQVSHQNLWNAAHRWTEKSKQPGGRFANLNISQSILPGARKEENTCKIPVQVTLQPEEQSNHKMLFDALSETTEHLFLIGQGGIGKTTALMYLMQNAYENRSYAPNVQVPIFVELSFAPDTYNALYDEGKSSFIRRSIYKQLRTDRILQQITNEELSEIDEAFMLPYKVAVAPINDILTQRCPAPEYLLLLDGLNEVSSVYIEEVGATVAEMVSDEIILLMTRCPNVRVVITSRTDNPLISNLPATRFYLSGVEKETIRDYLLSNGISDVDARLENSALLHVLQIPLFLSIYATLTNRENITTQGEIFRTFFHERRKNIDIYTVQNRLDAIERNIIDSAGRNHPNRLTAEMQQFALDFLLPELAWYMERNNLFYLRPKQIEKIFLPVLTDTSDEAICGDFGKDVFTKFHKGGAADMHTGKIAKDILQCLGLDSTAVTEKLINCCVHALGILQCSSRKYGFIHQHIRAYFAAVKCMNTLRLAAYLHEEGETESARICMNTVFAEAPVPFHVRRFLGEALGEHQNPLCRYDRKRICKAEDDRLLIQRALDVYRHQFNGENGYTLYSLLCTAIQVRGYLAGYDLSHLDLTGCPLNGAGLSQKQIPANISGAKIRQEDIFFQGHTDPIQQMDISQDGTMILTGSWDGLKIWDIRTSQLIKSVETSDALMLAAFIEEDTQLLAVTHTDNPNTVTVELFDFTTGEISRKSCDTFDLRQDITRVQLSPDRKHLLFVTRYGQKPTLHHSESAMSHTYALWYERNLMNRRKKLQLTDPVYRGVVQILTVPDLNPVWTKKYESDRIIALDAAFFPTGDQAAISIRYSHSIWDTSEPEYEDSCNIICVVLPEGTETTLLQLPATPKIHITEDSNFLCWTPEHLKLFAAENGSCVTSIPCSAPAKQILCSDTGRFAAVISQDQLSVYDLSSLQLIREIKTVPVSVCFRGDELLAVSDTSNRVTVYTLPLMHPVLSFMAAAGGHEYDRIACTSDGSCFAILWGAGHLSLWDMDRRVLIKETEIQPLIGAKLGFSPCGRYLYHASQTEFFLYSAADFSLVYRAEGTLLFSPNGKYLGIIKDQRSLILDSTDFRLYQIIDMAEINAFFDDCVLISCYSKPANCENYVCDNLKILSVQAEETHATITFDSTQPVFSSVVASNEQYRAISSDEKLYVWDCQNKTIVAVYPKIPFEMAKNAEAVNNYFTWLTETRALSISHPAIEAGWFQESDVLGKDTIKIFRSPSKLSLHDRKNRNMLFELPVQNSRDYLFYQNDTRLVVLSDRVELYALENPNGTPEHFHMESLGVIPREVGLSVLGADLRNLHPTSVIPEEKKQLLRQYGARI